MSLISVGGFFLVILMINCAQNCPVGDIQSLSLSANNNNQSSLQSLFKLNLIPAPAKTAESVNLEHEAIPSKILTAYDDSHKKFSDLTYPAPILDTISEGEKYQKKNDVLQGVSRSIVNGYETFSNLLNRFIDKPKEVARSISKGITAQLDVIGGKLIGL